jgi:uncharacterized protein YuzE
MAKFEIDYDKEFDDLYLYRKDKKAEVSINLGSFVIDATKSGQIVGIEMMEASSTLTNLLGSGVSKGTLDNLTDATVHVNAKDNALFVAIILNPGEDEIRVPLVLPAISE